MKNVSMICCLFVFNICLCAQETVLSSSILAQIQQGEEVVLENATIAGDLDFTTMKNPKKGGRYGISRGVAQEYFYNLKAPVSFTNCVFTGEIKTRSERRVGRELQENYTEFFEPVAFINCNFKAHVTFERMRIKDEFNVTACVFEKDLIFHSVKFSQKPTFSDNTILGKFQNKSNWPYELDKKAKPPKQNLVKVTLNNPTNDIIKIKFGKKTWRLSPKGSSDLSQPAGVQIFILEKSKKRLALTLNENMQNQTFDISLL